MIQVVSFFGSNDKINKNSDNNNNKRAICHCPSAVVKQNNVTFYLVFLFLKIVKMILFSDILNKDYWLLIVIKQ